jgi:hypothetical protein
MWPPLRWSQSRSESLYDWWVYSQSVRLETHDQYFFSQLNTRGHRPYVTSSYERMGLSFTIAAGPRQRSHPQIRVPRDSWHFNVSDSRPYSCVRIRCRESVFTETFPRNGSIGNTASSTVAGLFVAADTRLPRRCLAMAVFIRCTIPAFSRHVTVCWNYNLMAF